MPKIGIVPGDEFVSY